LLILAGVSILYETLWGMALISSIILCLALVFLSPNIIYPVIGYVFLGISVISTIFLFVVKSEF